MTHYSKIYRILHWMIAIAFLLLLITIFLRSTWMNKHNMAAIIGNYLSDTGQTLSHKQLITVAKQIREPMWMWHIYLGYALTGLFSLRLILPFFGEMKFQNPLIKGQSFKDKLKKWSYIVFYVCVLTSLFTGLMVKFGPEKLEDPMEDIHVLGIYYLIGFIVLHWAGVLLAEYTDEKGIISRIVSGAKRGSKDE